MKKATVLTFLIAVVYLLHQDFWNWNQAEPLVDLFLRSPGNVLVFGYLPVVPMVLGSAFCMVAVSLVTKAPTRATLEKYFSTEDGNRAGFQNRQMNPVPVAQNMN